MKRNAHVCTTIAVAWLLFSFFAILEWRDAQRYVGDPTAIFNFGIWGFQLLFTLLAVYFHRTESPREVLWFGDTEGLASGCIHINDVSTLLNQLALRIPELTESEIEKIVELAHHAEAQEGTSIVILITLRGRSEKFTISFEVWDDNTLEVFISTHLDLAADIGAVLTSYEELIEAL